MLLAATDAGEQNMLLDDKSEAESREIRSTFKTSELMEATIYTASNAY